MSTLTVRLLDGDSPRVLGTLETKFSQPLREQAVRERLDQLFDIEPLGGRISAFTNAETASGNAKALQQLLTGANARIDIHVQRRPNAKPTASGKPIDPTYQRIVAAVWTALKDGDHVVGQNDTDPKSYSNAITGMRDKIDCQDAVLRELMVVLANVDTNSSEVKILPALVRDLLRKNGELESQLAESQADCEAFKSRYEKWKGRYETCQREKQRLAEELREQHLPQQLEGIFHDEPLLPPDGGRI